jgi:hypothetical protein
MALTSPACSARSVGIVRLWTTATELSLLTFLPHNVYIYGGKNKLNLLLKQIKFKSYCIMLYVNKEPR